MIAELFGISRQTWYKRLKRQQERAVRDEIVLDLVKQERQKMPRLGTRKLYKKLKPRFQQLGVKMGRDKLFTLLRTHNMLVPKKKNYKKTTRSFHHFYQHPNRIKELPINRAEQVWVSDITYISTEQEYCYLSLITDAYSKKIMGYRLADHLHTTGPLAALQEALRSRVYPERELIHHSDRGLQYCSKEYTHVLDEHDIQISMTQDRDPYENAVAERINGILKTEFGIGEGFIHHAQAQKEIGKVVEIYNQQRPHMSCGMQTPQQAHHNENFRLKKWTKTRNSEIQSK